MENKRRNLSGIYIFDKFPGEDHKSPTCIEDCQEETRKNWLEDLEKEALINVIERLSKVLRDISDEFDIIGGHE